jgi:hypothetical protein
MMLNTARVFVSDLSGAHGFYANKLGLALKFAPNWAAALLRCRAALARAPRAQCW